MKLNEMNKMNELTGNNIPPEKCQQIIEYLRLI